MLKIDLKTTTISLFVSILLPTAALAQDQATEVQIEAETLTTAPARPRIKRVVEPTPYWVEADQLRVRDNPYAGDVVGMLKIGQKIKVRKTVDDWVLISAEGKDEQWVNKNFLSNSPVTWANYSFDSRNTRSLSENRFGDARYDVKRKRIKIKDMKDVRVYAADVKRLAGNQKLVISRHDYRAGAYFEKRMVKCDASSPTHVKLLGEGYTVMMMEADPRNQRVGVPMSDQDQIENDDMSKIDKAIAGFTCEIDKL